MQQSRQMFKPMQQSRQEVLLGAYCPNTYTLQS